MDIEDYSYHDSAREAAEDAARQLAAIIERF
jgi:hypothetical protein